MTAATLEAVDRRSGSPSTEEPTADQLSPKTVTALVMETLQAEPLWPSCRTDPTILRYHRQAVDDLVGHLVTLGDTWQQRWELFEQRSTVKPWWQVLVGPSAGPHAVHYNQAFGQLARHDVIRPSHRWVHGKALQVMGSIPGWRDPQAAAELTAQYASLNLTNRNAKSCTWVLGSVCANTGKGPREVTSDDLVAAREVLKMVIPGRQSKGINSLWTTMRQLGWFGDVAPVMPHPTRRAGQRTPEQLIHRFLPHPSPQREVLVEYVKARAASMDYSSLANLVRHLGGNFWADISTHHPDLVGFTLDPAQAEAWKSRLGVRRNGQTRKEIATLFAVRAFYLDIADWALSDSYWAPWVTRCPVSKADLKVNTKRRRLVVANQQQRTRELAPLLPALVQAAETYRRQTRTDLEAARAVGVGGQVVLDGQEWTVCSRTDPTQSFRVPVTRDGRYRYLGIDEDTAFWTWAAIETLRHSGLRLEEMLELTHLAVQPYTIKPTGETIPLLHIVPSKTDEERLIVAGPELVHVLSTVVARVRGRHQAVPLTQRWDPHEQQLGQPLPHLFVHLLHNTLHPMTSGTIYKGLHRLAAQLNVTVGGRPARFTPHDFRRLFATEALANGIPPHIVQVLLGHRSLATTQGYAAIYPQDVIRSHRSLISLRRRTRPSEEYREPTPEEWAEFEAHFVQRKVSLGSCGRGYGTSCQHEHACLRCGLLRPDPAQADRLQDIIDNLADRITEAEQNNWLGEVEGLRISAAAAAQKLDQMRRQLGQGPGEAFLGLPGRRVAG